MTQSPQPEVARLLHDRADLDGLVKTDHPYASNAMIVSVPFEKMDDPEIVRRLERARKSLIDDGFEVEGTSSTSMMVKLLLAEHKVGPGFRPRNPSDHPDHVGRGEMLAVGPLVREEGMTPRRASLRRENTYQPYVVSEQGIPDGTGTRCRPFFSSGRYYDNRKAAVAKFLRVMMNLETVTLDDLKDA